MKNEQPKRLTLEDCKIDWEHYRESDSNGCADEGPSTLEEALADRETICGYSETRLITRDKCSEYIYFDYYPDLFEQYCKENNISEQRIEIDGLVKMFNDGWITSPVYVNWKNQHIGFNLDIQSYKITDWLFRITNAQTQVDILRYIIKNADYLFGSSKKDNIPHIKAILSKCEVVAKEQQEIAQKKAAEEKAKKRAKKEKPEYVLSVEEIIQYVREENPDAAPAIRAMLRYFADEKDGWNSKAVKALLEPIKAQNFNFYAPVGNAIGNVERLNNNKDERE